MIQVTSLKDVETYLYTSVVLPLKGLRVDSLHFPSPISDKRGYNWSFELQRMPVLHQFAHQYEREQAERERNWGIFLNTGRRSYEVGEYHPKKHWVKLYKDPFDEVGAKLIFSKLVEVLSTNTPFTDVKIQDHPPVIVDVEAPVPPLPERDDDLDEMPF